jgi:hypothetical protein
MRNLTPALVLACLLSACGWTPGRGDGSLACRLSYDGGTFTLLVREDGVERAVAKTGPLSKEELKALEGFTCTEARDAPCERAAYVKDPKTGKWTSFMFGPGAAKAALLEELFRDLPVVVANGGNSVEPRIIGSEPNPCRLGPPGVDPPAAEGSAFKEATFAMTFGDRAFDVPADRLAIALEEGATLDWFRPGAPLAKARQPERQVASFLDIGLVDVAKLLAWSLGVLGGVAAIWSAKRRRGAGEAREP